MRYHKEVFFPASAEADLQEFTALNNTQSWEYSGHCLDNIKFRVIDLRALLEFIRGYNLAAGDIFEYYTEAGRVIKACYRVAWSAGGLDIILVINDIREIITIYLNSPDDIHVTLDKNLYAKG
jgi:hypothetical protein